MLLIHVHHTVFRYTRLYCLYRLIQNNIKLLRPSIMFPVLSLNSKAVDELILNHKSWYSLHVACRLFWFYAVYFGQITIMLYGAKWRNLHECLYITENMIQVNDGSHTNYTFQCNISSRNARFYL